MNDKKKTLFRLFLSLVVIYSLIHAAYSQENKTEGIIQQENGITHFQNATSSESPEENNVLQGEILIESQRNFDRSLNILNIAATSMAILVGLITLLFALAGLIGYSINSAWKEIRIKCENQLNESENHLKIIKKYRKDAENEFNSLRGTISDKKLTLGNEKLEKLNIDDIKSEKLSKEDIQELEDFHIKFVSNNFEIPSSEDYYNDGLYHFNKGLPELALKDFETAIEMKSDNEKAWIGKGVMLVRLNRDKEALKVYDKLLQNNPQNVQVLYLKGIPLHKTEDYDEAIKYFVKAIELKTDKIAEAMYNIACAYSLKGDKENTLSNLKEAIRKDVSNKKNAKEDKDFQKFWNDKDFLEFVS